MTTAKQIAQRRSNRTFELLNSRFPDLVEIPKAIVGSDNGNTTEKLNSEKRKSHRHSTRERSKSSSRSEKTSSRKREKKEKRKTVAVEQGPVYVIDNEWGVDKSKRASSLKRTKN
jgi:hypothetical protein